MQSQSTLWFVFDLIKQKAATIVILHPRLIESRRGEREAICGDTTETFAWAELRNDIELPKEKKLKLKQQQNRANAAKNQLI